MDEKKNETAKADIQLAIQASPCWARGKEIFLISLLQAEKPPKKAAIDEFMNDHQNLDSTVKSCETLQNASDSVYNSGRGGKFMGKLIETLTVIRDIADPFMEFAPESVGIAYFAICSLVQIGAADAQNCEMITDVCNNIATILLNCRLYENRYQDASYASSQDRMGDAELEKKIIVAIPDVISLILDFSWYVKQLLTKNRFVRALKATFSTSLKEKIAGLDAAYANLRLSAGDAFQERIMDSLEDLLKNVRQDREELRSILFPQIEDIQEKLGDISKVKTTVELSAMRKEFQITRSDLRPSNTHLQQFQAVFDPVSRHADHICQWLFSDPHYKRWEQLEEVTNEYLAEAKTETVIQVSEDETHKTPSMFFVQAHPGFGKSVTLASVVRRLTESTDSILAYFFFKQGSDETQTTLRALTSLATQLCDDRFARTEDELVRLMSIIKQLKPSPTAGGQAEDGSTNKSSNPAIVTIDTLKATIRNIGANLKRNVYIVVDAIDECIDHEAEKLVPYLTELSRAGYFKIMFSSRENKDLEKMLVGENNPSVEAEQSVLSGCMIANQTILLSITEDRTSADMEIFLTSSLQRIMAHRSRGYQSRDNVMADMLQIVRNIQSKAKGMFTYAAIVIASLEQPSQMTLAHKLRHLPKGMDDLYRQRLESLNNEEKKLVVTALKYITWGFGNISTIEIAEHFKMIYEEQPVDNENHPGGPADSEILSPLAFDPDYGRDLTNEVNYDALTDPEVSEAIYHLAQSGRDFFKFSNQQREIDLVHKTVRDWVVNEGKRITNWEETLGAHAPKVGVTRAGVLQLDLPLPPGLLSSGDGTSVELQSERDAHLDIAIKLLTVLSHPKFAYRYLGGPLPENKTIQGDKNALNHLASTKESKAETPMDSTIFVAIANSQDDARGEGASLAVDEEDQAIHPLRNVDRTYSFAVPRTKKIFRYEALHWLSHMQRLEELWPKKEDRKSPKWTSLWKAFDKFIASESYRLWLSEYFQFKLGLSVEWSQREEMYLPPLHLAVKEDSLLMVDYLLDETKIDPNIKDGKGDTAIHLAEASADILKLLVKHGATVDAPSNSRGITLFNKICSDLFIKGWIEGAVPPAKNYVDVAIALIDSGVDVKSKIATPSPECRRTPLQVAVAIKSLPMFERLMRHPDTDIHAMDEREMTALNWMHYHISGAIPYQETKIMVKALLEAGADPNTQDNDSMAPLSPAVMLQDKECVEMLLDHGADVNDDSKSGFTALHIAAGNQRFASDPDTSLSIVRLLLMHGANWETEDKDGWPPLIFAANYGYEKVFRWLIREYERKYGETDRSYLTKEYGDTKTTMLHCVSRNLKSGIGILKYLMEIWAAEKIDIGEMLSKYSEKQPLHMALMKGNLEVAKIFLDAGADIYALHECGDSVLDIVVIWWVKAMSEMDFYTPKQLELQRSLEECCLFLLDRAPDLVKKSGHNLRWAIRKGSKKIISKLVECGEDMEWVDEYGWSAFEYAVTCNKLETLKDINIPQFLTWTNGEREVRKTNLPFRLSRYNKAELNVSTDDGVTFTTSDAYFKEKGAQFATVLANCPVPAHVPVYYWEVKIIETEEVAADFVIGLISDLSDNTNPAGYTVQFNGDSFGIQGIDGGLLAPRESKNEDIKVSLRKYYTLQGEITFGGGHTVGCGYSNETGMMFFTLDGQYLGPAFENVWGRWWPTIGTFEKCKAKVNFGAEPFEYEDMRKYYEKMGLDKIVAADIGKWVEEEIEIKAKREKEEAEKKEKEKAEAEEKEKAASTEEGKENAENIEGIDVDTKAETNGEENVAEKDKLKDEKIETKEEQGKGEEKEAAATGNGVDVEQKDEEKPPMDPTHPTEAALTGEEP